MARALQDRLALANIKMTRGWQNRSLDSIEPELELQLKRKRTSSNADLFSDTSSSVSGRCFSTDQPVSSPLSGPFYSDDLPRSGSSQGSAKRPRSTFPARRTAAVNRTSFRPKASKTTSMSCKTSYNLPESSPLPAQRPSRGNPVASFASETSTVLDNSSASEDDDQDIPLHSFQFAGNHVSSSPPRTPPPDIARSARLRNKSFSSTHSEQNPVKEGADLLLYLASSPSPAVRFDKTPMLPPATPPAKSTPLPSSMMMTPGNPAYFGFGPNTPSVGFNFADYVNVTPSPAQAAFVHTPGHLRTPVAGKDGRRRVNLPFSPTAPNSNRSNARGEGLGMELGGELRP